MDPGHADLPTFSKFRLPLLESLKDSGGSAHRGELIEDVQRRSGLTDEQLDICYPGTDRHVVAHRIGWALSSLKKIGAVNNSQRGVWSVTETGSHLTSQDQIIKRSKEARRAEAEHAKAQLALQGQIEDDSDELDSGDPESQWRTELLNRLTNLSPGAFERLTQRLLREAGFHNVEVQGKSGDGGIDGVGDYRLSLVSFPVFFQCKRYSSSVGADAVRNFRGAMAGRGEKGLLVTTGTFTSGAREEATRDGAPPVQLVNGDELCDLLKEYELGVTTKQVVQHIEEVDTAWFDQFESP